jgi:hypothetical protein
MKCDVRVINIENEMCGACSSDVGPGGGGVYMVLVGKPEGRRSLG